MNYLLGATSVRMQVDYVRTCLIGEAQEWFLQNMEWFNHLVHNWNLEIVIQGLQKRFLHTLMYHHMSHKFDMVAQGSKIVQELMNDLTKYTTWMIQLPDNNTFWWWFVSALWEMLYNEVLKKGYNTELSLIDQLCKMAHIIIGNGWWRHCDGRFRDNMHKLMRTGAGGGWLV